MNKSKIFICEFASSGGFNQKNIPSSLFCEGFGMLRSIIEDFRAIDFTIHTLLDYRISYLSKYLQADNIKYVSEKDSFVKEFETAVKESEYCFIIAPEFSNILYNLTKIVKINRKALLSVDLKGIELGTSKFKNYKFFTKNELTTPQTHLIPFKAQLLDSEFVVQKFNELKTPIVIKPDDGVGAESIYYIENESHIESFFKENSHDLELGRPYVLQNFVEGKDLSVSLIGLSTKSKNQQKPPVILSVNAQEINIKSSNGASEYFGGYTPAENCKKIHTQLETIFKRVDFSIFCGYFGIDFVRTINHSIFFIEINPRLTTSYVGLRNIIDINPAELIYNSKMDSSVLPEIKIIGFSKFTKLNLSYTGNKSKDEINDNIIPKLMKEIPELVTPPIILNSSNNDNNFRFSCFIATKTKNLLMSINRINEIRKIVENFDFKVETL